MKNTLVYLPRASADEKKDFTIFIGVSLVKKLLAHATDERSSLFAQSITN
jgi:hypothetical protein